MTTFLGHNSYVVTPRYILYNIPLFICYMLHNHNL